MNLDHVVDIDEGRLVSPRAALTSAVDLACASGRPLVLHFHGGLVSRDSALAGAPALQAFYEAAGAYPLIPVWKTGGWEVAQDIWVKIAAEALFKTLVDRVTGLVHARMADFLGSRSASVERTLPKVSEAVLADSATGRGDFSPAFLGLDPAALRGDPDLALRPFQRRSIEAAVQADLELNQVVDAVLAGANLPVEPGARSAGLAPAPAPLPSVADREALASLQGEANTRGLGIGTAVAVVTIVAKVIGRYIRNADHGLHATVVEEVLRKFYLGAIGLKTWTRMKEYTQMACSPAGGAGLALIDELQRVPATQRVLLVGHSAGSIFISELFRHLPAASRPFEVVFLAPAATVSLFHEAFLPRASHLAADADGDPCFRMYSMNDDYESRDTLVRNVLGIERLTWFYPRSLLYLISGILEPDEDDAAVLGLQRVYLPGYRLSADPAITAAREFIETPSERRVWSVQDHPDLRFRSNSTSHGGFGSPIPGNTSMESVAALLKQGW